MARSFQPHRPGNIPAAAEGKRDYYRDAKEPGLLICVTSTGIKSFQVYLKQDGSPARVTLGHFSASLADSVEIPRDCSHSFFSKQSRAECPDGQGLGCVGQD